MNRLLTWSALAVLVLGWGQSVVPGWVAQKAARALQARDGGVRPTIEVAATPFWLLAAGKFQAVRLSAKTLPLDGLTVRGAHLVWMDGAVNLAALRRGRLTMERRGAMTIGFTVTARALAGFLGKRARLDDPTVHVNPFGVRVSGRVRLGGTWIPVVVEGSLMLAGGGEAVVFSPRRIDGARLPVPTAMDVFNLRRAALPVPLKFTRMVLGQDWIRFRAVSS